MEFTGFRGKPLNLSAGARSRHAGGNYERKRTLANACVRFRRYINNHSNARFGIILADSMTHISRIFPLHILRLQPAGLGSGERDNSHPDHRESGSILISWHNRWRPLDDSTDQRIIWTKGA